MRARVALPKYKGNCCNGTRVWGANDCRPYTFVNEKGAEFSVFCCGACRQPLPLPQLPPAATPVAAVTSPVTLTVDQRARMEQNKQEALARKRRREEQEATPQAALLSPLADAIHA